MALEAADTRELLPGLGDQPGHLMWRAAARVTANLAEVLPEGVDIHAYAALLSLADGVGRSQQSIATTIDVSRTTMVKVAADLAEQELIERVRNPADRRSYVLTRTAAGAAAAQRWRVPPRSCTARQNQVIHTPSGATLSFGELAIAASKLPTPKLSDVVPRPDSELEHIGRALPLLDAKAYVTGQAVFGADVRINLFNGFANTARMAEASHARTRALAERERVERRIEVDVRAALAHLAAARAREAAGRTALDQARESQRIIRDRYDGGLATVTDVLRAAEAALDAESRATAAEMDVILQTVALDRALGRL